MLHKPLYFTQDSQVLSIAQLAMKFECIAIFFMAISIGANMLFQSISRSVIATFLANFEEVAWLLSHLLSYCLTYGVLQA